MIVAASSLVACSTTSAPDDAAVRDASAVDTATEDTGAADAQVAAPVGAASWTVTMSSVEFRSALITYRADAADPRRREYYYGASGAAGLDCAALAVVEGATSTYAALRLPEAARAQSVAVGNFSTAAATLFADVSMSARCNAGGECGAEPNGGLFSQGFNIERSCTLTPAHAALGDVTTALPSTIRLRCSDATSTIEVVARVCPPPT